jgi:hypothetical protein
MAGKAHLYQQVGLSGGGTASGRARAGSFLAQGALAAAAAPAPPHAPADARRPPARRGRPQVNIPPGGLFTHLNQLGWQPKTEQMRKQARGGRAEPGWWFSWVRPVLQTATADATFVFFF